ncbi:MAG: TadE/TadG family type IV pilus assembly protein [Kiloniellaceae bacterium]
MVMRRRGLACDGRGTSSVEFAAVAFVFLLAVLGVVDFGRALWEWNAAAKATQAGVRYAVVSDLAARNLRTLDGTRFAPIGMPVPAASVSPNPTVCAIEGCGPGLRTLDAAVLDATAFGRIVARMRAHDPRIGADNVVVEYRHVGLGLAGNPAGPDIDPVVTVRLRDMRFEFMALALLRLPPIEMPEFRATLTGEDGRGV